MRTSSLLDQAESWAASLWEAARDRWPEREGQDCNYRLHVVHPTVRSVLRKYLPERGFSVLDLGCGDGAFLDDPENRAMIGNDGSYLGVDVSTELIGRACTRHGGDRVRFLEGNLGDSSTADRISGTGIVWDAALSVFVVQEMPDAGQFFALLGRILPAGGLAVTVTVHPSFGEWLRNEGRMETADRLAFSRPEAPELYRWAGRYPIVDDPREPFFLPYFHRTEEDYRDTFLRAGFAVREMRGIPGPETRGMLRERGISPFIPFETNRYWPRIAEEPSALLLIAVKGVEV